MSKSSGAAKPAGARRRFAGADKFVPDQGGVDELADAIRRCEGCDLYQRATQAVMSRGSTSAAVVLVGEQPGDVEDKVGSPFVGPAGRLLDRALSEAGIAPDTAYLTNAVKHFKFEQRGKRRIHQRPQRGEVVACRPWLIAELRTLRPRVIVALGATATSSLCGSAFRLTERRGQLLRWTDVAEPAAHYPASSAKFVATIHPSAVLRDRDRDSAYDRLVADLRVAARAAR